MDSRIPRNRSLVVRLDAARVAGVALLVVAWLLALGVVLMAVAQAPR